ncbi:hypothetical protein BDV06DRAFT_20392 [Aspergillus oleicola]
MNLLSLLRPRRSKNTTTTPAEVYYGLDHALLNIPLPPPSMWMNLGYWEDTNDFPTACAALLNQVLITAGLLDEDGIGRKIEEDKKVNLVDVGIGCGDQSVRCLGYRRANIGDNEGDGGEKKPLFDSYVGITSLPVQARFAKERVDSLLPSSEKGEERRAQIFCTNAAIPSSWPDDLKSSLPITPLKNTTTTPDLNSAEPKEETWLLALDTLYHFTPSRLPLFTYAHDMLQSNIMTFDLLLPTPKPSLWNRLLLRLLCFLGGIPYSNFLSEDEYKSLLASAGYDVDKIKLRDISAHVFPGISSFLKSRIEEGRMFGLGKMGKFKGAKRLFSWWATSGAVRGVVVVARC